MSVSGPPTPAGGGTPKVSVIVPNYRHEKYLPERLDSILNQTFQDYEIILLDDKSPDGSVAVLEDYAERFRAKLGADQVQTCFNTENSGSVFKQWNRGVGMARGEYVWIAESDDVAEPGLLETLVGKLEGEAGTVVAFCDTTETDASGAAQGRFSRKLPGRVGGDWSVGWSMDGEAFTGAYLSLACVMPNASAVLFSAEAYQRMGGARTDRAMCGDWSMWSRLCPTGGVVYEPMALNRWRRHDLTVRHTVEQGELMFTEALSVMRDLAERVPRPAEAIDRGFEFWHTRYRNYLDRPGTVVTPGGVRSVLRGLRSLYPGHSLGSTPAIAWAKALGVHSRLGWLRLRLGRLRRALGRRRG